MCLAIALLLAFSPQAEVEIRQRTIHSANFDFKYPEIVNEPPFNDAVRAMVAALMKEVQVPWPKDIHGHPHPGDLYIRGEEYKVAKLNNGVVSVLFTWARSYPGAAHPWGELASINYDTRTKKVLLLSDLFTPGSDYLSRLSQLAIASLNQQHTPDVLDPQELRPRKDNFKAFAMTDTALVLHFAAGKVAHQLLGEQTVVIPLDALSAILRRH